MKERNRKIERYTSRWGGKRQRREDAPRPNCSQAEWKSKALWGRNSRHVRLRYFLILGDYALRPCPATSYMSCADANVLATFFPAFPQLSFNDVLLLQPLRKGRTDATKKSARDKKKGSWLRPPRRPRNSSWERHGFLPLPQYCLSLSPASLSLAAHPLHGVTPVPSFPSIKSNHASAPNACFASIHGNLLPAPVPV